jgi:hypothetical protein
MLYGIPPEILTPPPPHLKKVKILDNTAEKRIEDLLNTSLLSFLGSTAQLKPWPPPQNPTEFLGGFSTIFFYSVGLLAPSPTPIPEDQVSVLFISLKGMVVSHFSRLLRHAWVTVGLFLFPGHHTGRIQVYTGYSYASLLSCSSLVLDTFIEIEGP